MIAAIEALRGPGKTLDLLEMEELSEVQIALADNEVLDPESPDEMFEPFGKHGMAQSWAKGKARDRAAAGAQGLSEQWYRNRDWNARDRGGVRGEDLPAAARKRRSI